MALAPVAQGIVDRVLQKARGRGKRIAISESVEPDVLRAARIVVERDDAVPVLVGDPSKIAAAAKAIGVSTDGMEIVDMANESRRDELATVASDHSLYFSHKACVRMSADPLNYAMMMLDAGMVDGVFSGVVTPTSDVLRAATSFVGLEEGVTSPSSFGMHYIPGYGENGMVLGVADSSVCIRPTSEELAHIAISSCDTFQKFSGIEPRAAMLSFSTLGTNSDVSIDRVRGGVKIANELRPDLKIEGEFQLDAAINPRVAAKKVKTPSEVAGKANVLIFPEINSGNIGWKLIQEFGHSQVICLVMHGFKKPVSDCSRGDTVDTIANYIGMLAARC